MQKKEWAENVTPGKQGFQPTHKGINPPPTANIPDGPVEPSEGSVSVIDDTHQRYLDVTGASGAGPADEYDVGDGMKWPQANDVWKIGGVVKVVGQGVSTAKAIAHTLGEGDRQGAYYAAAAESLGLLEREPDNRPAEWRLTPLGVKYDGFNDSRDEANLLKVLVENHEAVQLRKDKGDAALQAAMCRDGLAADTAQRRADGIKSWSDWAQAEGHDSDLREFSDLATSRVEEARQIKEKQKRAQQQRSRPEPPPVCSECFLEMPTSEGSASGVCVECGG
jgi:hypothetical protein